MRLWETLGDGYTQRALAEAAIVGVLCGAVGVHVVLRRLSFLATALTHATFPGVVIAALLGVHLVLGAGVFGLLLVGVVAAVAGARGGPAGGLPSAATGRGGRDLSSVTGVVLSGGFALGVALMSAQDGFTRDLTAFLVGSILTVGTPDLVVSAVTAVVVLTLLAALRKELLLGAFDPAALAAAGYPARRLDLVVLAALELTVVTTVPAVGTIMAIALVVGPAATARLWCDRTGPMTALSMGLGVLAGVAGLAVSAQWDVAAGGAIVLTVAAMFVLSLALTGRAHPRPRPATT
ncbi:metal ABC transporter permease [Frankia sp. CNm7]|uniref:Metal ABC transporter permease n=1 Tax=Frankia nepalensis TaxID=1836974 RepID=A0A937RC74_9ACTN|nr:metal ABC transporter permease [Frankia nepalensis]MBL7495356.1 metal ABC transporter permease [Frankia nepalensis]MBL7514486.1 metal ABC transporter permease [Frankia nepalensis]MBL7518566.1 metal ABC transporter permease [Frankia nepalensis]MBL7627755.1 metal ABC transporter permease [Frankia nepalensis]